MVIWMPQLGSTRQIGLDITLKGVLNVVGSAIAGAEEVRAEFFALRLWDVLLSSQPCNNRQSYGQMDVAVVFSMSERFRNNLGKNSDSSGRMLYSREKWIGLDYIASENVIGRAVRLSCRPGLQPTGI
jgi:hypothetical protein